MTNRKWILLVDDDANDAELARHALLTQPPSSEVVHANGGAEALECLRGRGAQASRAEGLPSLVLLDLKMPRMDGFEVLRQMKADPRLKTVPVVVFTSSRNQADLERSYQLGANACVLKPADFQDWAGVLRAVQRFWLDTNEAPLGQSLEPPMPSRGRATLPAANGNRHRVSSNGAKNEIRILLLEDNPTDADLVFQALKQGGLDFQWKHVDNKPAYRQQLERFAPDLILSDFSLPEMDGYTALEMARKHCPDTPFIFVTGTLGEELAIETLKKGATDNVLKHRMGRLVPSVQRALREADVQTKRRRAEEQLRLSHQQLRALSIHLQDVREEERIRIAREVHDELGQALTGLKLQLTWLASRLPKAPKVLHRKARFIADRIDETIHTVRRIATELRPGVLDTAGLLAALEWQANEFQKDTGISCRVRSTLPETIWNQDLNTAFFRIFQETLTNVIRHANATKVEVALSEAAGHFVLQVKDNGRGISEREIQNTTSIGLLGMRERAALLGGEVRLQGKAGVGTTVTVRIPRPLKRSGRERKNSHENTADRRSRRGAARVEAHPR